MLVAAGSSKGQKGSFLLTSLTRYNKSILEFASVQHALQMPLASRQGGLRRAQAHRRHGKPFPGVV